MATCENEFYTLRAYTTWIVSKLSVSIIVSVNNTLNDIQIGTMTTSYLRELAAELLFHKTF